MRLDQPGSRAGLLCRFSCHLSQARAHSQSRPILLCPIICDLMQQSRPGGESGRLRTRFPRLGPGGALTMPTDAKKSATPDMAVRQMVEAALGPARTSRACSADGRGCATVAVTAKPAAAADWRPSMRRHQDLSPHLLRAFGSEELREVPKRRGRVGHDHVTDAGRRSRSGLVSPRISEVRRVVGASLAEREGPGCDSPQLHHQQHRPAGPGGLLGFLSGSAPA